MLKIVRFSRFNKLFMLKFCYKKFLKHPKKHKGNGSYKITDHSKGCDLF